MHRSFNKGVNEESCQRNRISTYCTFGCRKSISNYPEPFRPLKLPTDNREPSTVRPRHKKSTALWSARFLHVSESARMCTGRYSTRVKQLCQIAHLLNPFSVLVPNQHSPTDSTASPQITGFASDQGVVVGSLLRPASQVQGSHMEWIKGALVTSDINTGVYCFVASIWGLYLKAPLG